MMNTSGQKFRKWKLEPAPHELSNLVHQDSTMNHAINVDAITEELSLGGRLGGGWCTRMDAGSPLYPKMDSRVGEKASTAIGTCDFPAFFTSFIGPYCFIHVMQVLRW